MQKEDKKERGCCKILQNILKEEKENQQLLEQVFKLMVFLLMCKYSCCYHDWKVKYC